MHPALFPTMLARPLAWPLILVNFAALAAIPILYRRDAEGGPFLASSALIASSLATAAVGLFPTLLRSTLAPANDLTATTAAAGSLNLSVGLWFWLVAIALAVVYFTYLFRSFRGKVDLSEGHSH